MQHLIVNSRLSHGRARTDGQFRAARQIEIIRALHVNRTCAAACAQDRADGCAFTPARNRPDDRADRRADGGALSGRFTATVAALLHRAFIVNACLLAVRCAHALDDAAEAVRTAVAQANRVEVQRHLRAPTDAPRTIYAPDRAFDDRARILRRIAHGHRKAITFARVAR